MSGAGRETEQRSEPRPGSQEHPRSRFGSRGLVRLKHGGDAARPLQAGWRARGSDWP